MLSSASVLRPSTAGYDAMVVSIYFLGMFPLDGGHTDGKGVYTIPREATDVPMQETD